jgi:restriction system protein
MTDSEYKGKIDDINYLRSMFAKLCLDSSLDKKTLERLLRMIPASRLGNTLLISREQALSFKREIKEMYMMGESGSSEFRKLISLIDYELRVFEHETKLNKIIYDSKKRSNQSIQKYEKQERELVEKHKKSQKEGERKFAIEYNREVKKFLGKHSKLVSNFVELANIKVSILDEYGNPSWVNLYIEIAKIIMMISEENGLHIDKNYVGIYKRTHDPKAFVRPYNFIALFLEKHFRSQFGSTELHKLTDYNDLSGVDFEAYIANILKSIGVENVVGTPITGDQGADLLFRIGNRKIAAQLKRYSLPVGNKSVQEIAGALKYYEADDGWVITNSTFTSSAVSLASKNGILLIDGKCLLFLKEILKKNLNYVNFIK